MTAWDYNREKERAAEDVIDKKHADLRDMVFDERHDYYLLNQEFEKVKAELAALKAAHAWIKTSERMPDPEVVVLVVSTQDYAEGEVCTAKCYTSTSGDLIWEHYSSETGEAGMDIESAYVTHWQPLPEPPK